MGTPKPCPQLRGGRGMWPGCTLNVSAKGFPGVTSDTRLTQGGSPSSTLGYKGERRWEKRVTVSEGVRESILY